MSCNQNCYQGRKCDCEAREVLRRLDLLLKDKLPNGAYVVNKENRVTIVQTEILIKKLLRKLYG